MARVILCNIIAILAGGLQLCLGGQVPCLRLSSASISSNQFQFTLAGTEIVGCIIEQSSDLQNWTPILTNDSPGISRLITMELSPDPSFYRARRTLFPSGTSGFCARENIDLKGNNISIDSFDSADPQYSTNGRYDPAKARDHGDVATASITNNAFNIGNARIKGKVHTGPCSTPTMGPAGSVGDAAWVDNFNPGIKSGWHVDDVYAAWPDVLPPYTTGLTPGSQTIGGTNYDYYLGSGQYLISGDVVMSTSAKMYVGGNATLFVTGLFHMQGNSYIYIAPSALLRLYVGGASTVLATINNSGIAPRFQYYGLSSNMDLSLTGTDYAGTIYAPNAALTFGSGGAAVYDFQGSFVVRSIKANGHCQFHYDENLRRQ